MTRIVKVQAPDGSIIKVEGPDNATDEQFIQQGATLYQQQQNVKATFDANQPEQHLGMNMSASTLWDELKKRTNTMLMGPKEGEPGYSPSTGASSVLGMVAPGGAATEGMGTAEGLAKSPLVSGAASAWDAVKKLIPNSARAGENFNTIREAAKDVAPNLEEAYGVIQKAKELSATGHGPISEGMSKMETAMQPARLSVDGKDVLVNPAPIKYPQSFDFASAAKNAASTEKAGQTGMMQGQVKQFAKALQTANRDAAAQVGMGDLYDAAMKEYRQAKTLEEAGDVLKKYGIKAAAVAGLGVAGREGYKLWDQISGK